MKHRSGFTVALLLCAPAAFAAAIGVNLGTAGSFAVLAGSTVTNTGDTVLQGNVGVSPGSAITGFPPGIVTDGTIYGGGSVAATAESDLMTAYISAAGEACTTVLTGNLSSRTLTPGVYCFSSSAELMGTLTLDAMGDPNAVFLFQIGSALTADGSSIVSLIDSGSGANVFWQVGSSATLGVGAAFEGNILASTSITLDTGATILNGSALAITGAVTLDTNTVDDSAVPEPATAALLGAGMLFVLWLRTGSASLRPAPARS